MDIRVLPENIDFGEVVVDTGSKPRFFSVVNMGYSNQRITVEAPTTPEFIVEPGGIMPCEMEAELERGEACTYVVNFWPIYPGTAEAEVLVHSGDVDSPDVLQLTGVGVR